MTKLKVLINACKYQNSNGENKKCRKPFPVRYIFKKIISWKISEKKFNFENKNPVINEE